MSSSPSLSSTSASASSSSRPPPYRAQKGASSSGAKTATATGATASNRQPQSPTESTSSSSTTSATTPSSCPPPRPSRPQALTQSSGGAKSFPEDPGATSDISSRLSASLSELDTIRLQVYRVACKVRCLQRITALDRVDLWSMIEAFRECGLQGPDCDIGDDHIRVLVTAVYDSLAKRLPRSVRSSHDGAAPGYSMLQAEAAMLFRFLCKTMRVRATSSSGKPSFHSVRSVSVKLVCALLSSGKLIDKLRYAFSQLADPQGNLSKSCFKRFVRDVARIPSAFEDDIDTDDDDDFDLMDADSIVGEDDSGYLPRENGRMMLTVNEFLSLVLSEEHPQPRNLTWVVVLHRIAGAESVFHSASCFGCGSDGFYGLRYQSRRLKRDLCQECFWRGSGTSQNDDDDLFLEFGADKKQTASVSLKAASSTASLMRSLNCLSPTRQSGGRMSRFQNEEATGDRRTAYSRTTAQRGASGSGYFEPSYAYSAEAAEAASADEHRLIARYANELAAAAAEEDSEGDPRQQHRRHHQRDSSRSRQMMQVLERKNREIIQEIRHLREQRAYDASSASSAATTAARFGGDSRLVSELAHLRTHRNDLEERLSDLHETRRALMQELEELMKLLQTQRVAEAEPEDLKW